jgi:hypothetical protein
MKMAVKIKTGTLLQILRKIETPPFRERADMAGGTLLILIG